MQATLTPEAVECMLGPSARILEGLLVPRLGTAAGMLTELYLDVLVHAAGAEGGMLVARDGVVLGRVGVSDQLAGPLTAACRGGMPRCLDQAQLLGNAGVATYTSMGVPLGSDVTLVLVRAGADRGRIDTDAMMAVLPGIVCALRAVTSRPGLAG